MLVRSIVASALALGLPAAAAGPAAAAAAADEECATAVAYLTKQRKADRERLILEAKQEALHALALRAWSAAVGLESETRTSRVAGTPDASIVTEDLTILETLQIKYQIHELLQGHEYRIEEPAKNQVKVWYCVPTVAFDEAKRTLHEQREQTIESFRARFAALDNAMLRRDFDYATSVLPGLKIEVENEVLSLASYASARSGRAQTFRAWLIEWDGQLDKGTSWARYLVAEAGQSIMAGHLGRADLYLNQASQADPLNPAIANMRRTVDERRAERREVLLRAEELAGVGRFSAADAQVEEAQKIDADDQRSLHKTRRRIEGLRTEYLVYNPRLSAVISFTLGSLGADLDRSVTNINHETGDEFDGGMPMSVGAAAQVRLGRQFLLQAGGSYGFAYDYDGSSDYYGDSYIDLYQLSVGLGYRTIRTERHPISLQILGGIALEGADASGSDTAKDTSDSRTGAFARIGVEWRHFSVFALHGFGFDDEVDPDSVIAWSDSFQIGAAFVY